MVQSGNGGERQRPQPTQLDKRFTTDEAARLYALSDRVRRGTLGLDENRLGFAEYLKNVGFLSEDGLRAQPSNPNNTLYDEIADHLRRSKEEGQK